MRAFKQLAPFCAAAAVAWIAVLFGNKIDWSAYAISVVLAIGACAGGLVAAGRGWVRSATVLGSIVFLIGLGLVRNASGGSSSGISLVSLLAVFQTALTLRKRRDLAVVLVAVAAFYLVPLILIGPPHYPSSGYRSALITVLVSSIIGIVTQGLVEDIRKRVLEARLREKMLGQVAQALRRVQDSSDPRLGVCRAVTEISGAVFASIYEPVGESGTLQITATTVDNVEGAIGTPAATQSAVYDALLSGKSVLLNDRGGEVERRVGSIPLWRASGSPGSILYEPLIRGDTRVGVLVAGWVNADDMSEHRARIASVLAHEAAGIIHRADLVSNLANEAYTDQLTSLPNRRAWDERLKLAAAQAEPFAVAMLDIDHFKLFNDSFGHPAGDRLLSEAARAWQKALRSGDFLARIGGEEFALLIFGTDQAMTRALVNRVRASTPQGQTCSAGITFRIGDEPAEAAVARADAALYEAKQAGRDRTRMSAAA